MKLKLLFVTLLVFLFGFNVLYSQSVNFRFGTHFYTWQRLDSISTTGDNTYTTHLRGYQNYLLEVKTGKWTFNTLAQTEEDVVNKIGDGFNYRFYNAYIKGTDLFNRLDLKLGRQLITAGVGRGTIDGAYLKLKIGKQKEFQIVGYGGYLTPYSYDFPKYLKLKDNFSLGGQLLYYGVKDLTMGLSYNLKHRELPGYYALRADSLFNTQTVFINTDSPADQTIGFDATYYDAKNKHSFFGKAYYDLNGKKFLRGEVGVRFSVNDKLKFSVGYAYREPRISYNSIFGVFNHSKNQEFEGGVDYLFWNKINAYIRISDVAYEGNNSLKFQAGFSHPSFGLSFVKYSGYSGESEGIFGYFNRDLYKQFSFSTGAGFSTYRISEYSDTRNETFTGSLGFVYRPSNKVSLDLQGQCLVNRIYKFDTRILFGFNYWLFKKL